MEAMDGDTGWYNVPSFRQYMASEEADVAEALNANFIQVLSETIWSRKDSTEGFHRHRRLARVNGEPDFILVGDEGSLFLVVEVKTKWVLPATHDDLVKKYSENHEDRRKGRPLGVSVINPLEQIFGYMSQNGLQYGVLSTYESTWFLCRPKDGPRNLLISEVVKDTGTNPSLFRCFAFIMSLARNDRASPIPVSPSPPETTSGGEDGDDSGTYNLRKRPPPSPDRGEQGTNGEPADKSRRVNKAAKSGENPRGKKGA